METIVEWKDFSFQYYSQKHPTLKEINLKISKGEKVLIAGLSGSGKSTLGNCMNGLIPFVYKGDIKGSCRIKGKETSDCSVAELSKTVGTVLQDSDGQFVGLSVGEDIAFAMENDCIDTETMHRRVKETADKLGISELLRSVPSELSGGQKQRVSLAGVMVDDVDILLFDEPLANLDPATGQNTIELIDEIQKESGKTIVIIEHRIEDVLFCHVDRIVLFEEGSILYDGSPDRLLASDLLTNSGIREPLSLSACKFAGLQIREEMHPSMVRSFSLNQEEKEQLLKWTSSKEEERKKTKEAILQVNDLSYSYDGIQPVVQDVSFAIHKGEMLALIGKNGAGKSTISKILSGFIRQDKGTILLNGRDIGNDTIFERGQKIGLVLQNPNQMICNPMIYDEVAYGLRNMKVSEEEIRERVEETLKVCGLLPFRNWPLSALSYGQKKRVTIASILVMKPDLLVLDEPTAGQDYKHYTEIMEFLEGLNEQGYSILIITHDMHLMLEYCDRAVVLCDGKKIFDGSTAEVLVNEELVKKANLKKTSLYDLAKQIDVSPLDMTRAYITAERRKRHEKETV